MKRMALLGSLLFLVFVAPGARAQTNNDDIINKIEVSFGQVQDVDWPLEKACKHTFHVRNTSGEFFYLQVDVSYQVGHVTLFPQPAFIPLDPGEQRTLISLVQYPIRESSVGQHEMTVTYTFRNRFGQGSLSKDFKYIFNKMDNEPFINITGSQIFTGRVMDTSGLPMANVKVTITCETCDGFFRETRTDNSGRYRLSLPEKDDWYLVASKDGYKSRYLFNLSPGSLDISMQPFRSVLNAYEVNTSVESDIGFWKQVPTRDGKKILLCQGMENWPDPSMKQRSQIMLYSMKGQLLWSHVMGDEAWGCDLTSDGSHAVYVTNPSSNVSLPSSANPTAHMVLLDGSTGSVLWDKVLNTTNFPYPDDPYTHETPEKFYSLEVQFSHDGQRIALGEKDNSVLWLINREDASPLWSTFLGVGQIRRIIFSRDDRYLYVGTGEGYLFKVEATSGHAIWKSDIESWPYTYGLALSPDERYIAAGTKSGMLSVIDTATGQLVWNKYMGIMNVRWVQFSPDGDLLAAGSGTPLGTCVFDAHTGAMQWKSTYSAVGMFTADGKHVFHADGYALFYSPDGTMERAYDPQINTTYWKVGYVDPTLTHFVVGARDLPDKRRALVFYKAIDAEEYFNIAPSRAMEPYGLANPPTEPAETIEVSPLQKKYIVIMPKLKIPENRLGDTVNLYWLYMVKGTGAHAGPFNLGRSTLAGDDVTFYISSTPLNLSSVTETLSICVGVCSSDDMSDLLYNCYDVVFKPN